MDSQRSRNSVSTQRPGDEIGPSRYVKKPVEIEAIKWSGHNLRHVIAFTGWHPSAEKKWTWEEYEEIVSADGLKIFTLEGPLKAAVGDFIIKGVKGEFYPCKPDIFVATYRRADIPAPVSENAPTQWRPMETAPRDGTLVLLLIYPDEERCCPLEDTEKGSRTVGHNNFEHDGDDRWLFSGWSWEQDHYTQGDGNPAGWMPLPEAT